MIFIKGDAVENSETPDQSLVPAELKLLTRQKYLALLLTETRVRDVQALQRRISLKCRDDPDIAVVLILLAATRSNRAVVRFEGTAFREEYPLPPREMLACLSKGRTPEASGVVLL